MRQLMIVCFCLIFSESLLALKPERNYTMTPDSMGISYKEIRLKTSDGFEINTWIFEPQKDVDKKCVLIMSGGDAGNMCYIIYQAYMLSQKGFRVITYDYRGFGKSSDFVINKDFLYYDEFVTDLQTVINYAAANFKDSRIGLYGFSMGTMISGFAAAKNPNISFYIADGFILDPLELISIYKAEGKASGRQILSPKSANQYATILKNLSIPFLIFAGTLDKHTPLKDAEEGIKQQKNRELIIFEGDHGQAFIKLTASKQTGDRYFSYISAFVDDRMK